MTRGRSYIFILILSILVMGGAWIAWKATNQKDEFHFRPEVFVSGIALEDPGDEILRAYVSLNIINDLPIEARVRELQFELRHEGNRVLQNLVKKNFTIQKEDTTEVILPLQIGKNDLELLNEKFGGYTSDSALFQLHITFDLDVPLRGYRSFDFDKTLNLPIFKLLTVESRKISIEKFSLKHPELEMDLKLHNPNSFPIVVDDFNLDLSVGKDLVIKGNSNVVQRLEANSSKTISIDMNVDDLNIFKLAWKSIVKDDKTPFKSRLSFTVVSKNKSIDKSRVVILKDGTLDEIKK